MRLVFTIFAIFGIGALIGSFVASSRTYKLLDNGIVVEGTVIDVSYQRSSGSSGGGSYYPLVEFEADGKKIQFQANYGSNPPAYETGDKVKVIYNPARPHSAAIKSFAGLWLLPMVFLFFGIAFIAPLGIYLGFGYHHLELKKYFKNNGRLLNLDAKVALDNSIKVNGNSPYCIHAEWLDPNRNELHDFKSSYIWFDPTKYIIGNKVNVKIDENNPKRYLMDISFLPKAV